MPIKAWINIRLISVFELSQLRCFVVLAEELHFGREAARLHMTQPPLSRQIQLLEHHIGAQLVERSSRNVHLTASGRGFLPEAREILRLAESASLSARRLSRGEAGTINIGFTASSGYRFLPGLILACRERLPEAILLDWNMPKMDGYEFLRSLRKLPGGDGPKVVFCTTENDVAHIARALHAGANEYIMKPFDKDIVEAKFQEVGLI